MKMNERITAAMTSMFIYFDVSAVYAAIFKRHNKHKWREDESSHNHNREKSHTQEREKRRETERHFDRDREKEIEEIRTHVNTLVEAHVETHSNINTGDGERIDQESSAWSDGDE